MVNFLITTVVLTAIWVEFYPSFASTRFIPPPSTHPLASSTSSTSASAYVSSKSRHCPCIFFVSTSLNSPNFDFLAIPSNSLSNFGQFTDSSLPFLADFSHLNLSTHNSFRRDKNQHVHQFQISVHHAFTIVLRFTNRKIHNTVSVSDHLRILTNDVSKFNFYCPAILPQQPPQNCDDCSQQKTGPVPLSSNTDTQEHTNLNPSSWIPPTLISTSDKRRSTNHDEPPSITSRIVGGHIANADLSNYLVAVETEVGLWYSILCSGTLVSPTIVLTAAHCVVNKRPIKVQVGRLKSSALTRNGRTIGVKSFTRYPAYRASASISESDPYDIAILTLKSEAPRTAKFMKVNMNKSIPIVGSFVRNVGYGFTSLNFDGEKWNMERNLYQVDSPVLPFETCLLRTGYARSQSGLMVCVGYTDRPGCRACRGDSGGPIIQYDADDEPVLVGIAVSGPSDCVSRRYPTNNVRTSAYADFIPDDEGIRRTKSTVAVMADEDPKEEPRLPLETAVPSETDMSPFPSPSSEESTTQEDDSEDSDIPRPQESEQPIPPGFPDSGIDGPEPRQQSSSNIGLIVGIVCAAAFVLVLVAIGVFVLFSRSSGGSPARNV